ncbi:MAG: twin-arginine translocase subunit TatC [Dehalococcoidia bacterium]|nr:MAG: twin-arginine translocase subunit TatC [Dehalococcoidia bacterium]
MSENQKSPVLEHLGELRRRLIRCLIAVVITSLIAFIFYEQIFNILKTPAPPNLNLQAIEMTEMIGTIMRVCLFSGIILAMPYLVYQALMFVFPALTPREKRYVYLILPWITLMFAGGVTFGYFILLPRITGFLMTFGGDIASIEPRIGSYINIVTRLLLATGLVFELPVVTTFLARIGLVSPKWLASKRKLALIFAFILAAIITPTIDPINQTLVAAPLIVLYEMSIWLAKLVYRGEKKAESLAPAVVEDE